MAACLVLPENHCWECDSFCLSHKMKLDIAEKPLTILSKDRTKPQNMTTKYQRHMQKKNNFLWLKAVWDFEKIFS